MSGAAFGTGLRRWSNAPLNAEVTVSNPVEAQNSIYAKDLDLTQVDSYERQRALRKSR